MTGTARARRTASSLLVLALLLTGCASVPDHGKPVKIGAAPLGDTQNDVSDVRQLPGKPQPGASPDRIVSGFLSASKSADARHQIARDFLSDVPEDNAARRTWDDTASTTIITATAVTVVGSGRVKVTGRIVGRLAKDGSYVADGRPLNLLFHLVQVGPGAQSQWRITNPPPGIMLLLDDFASTYRPVDVYFLSRDGESVVPDHRYIDVNRAGLATELVRLLLAGPSRWLAPGVHTEFPPGTQVRSNVVQPSIGGDLTVDLTGQAEVSNRPQAAQIAAQLVWTLRRFNVGVRVTVNGRPLQVPDQGAVLPPSAYGGYDSDRLPGNPMGYFIADGVLRQASGPDATNLPAATGVPALSAALSPDSSALAVVRAAGKRRQLLIGNVRDQLSPVLTGESFTRPSWGGRHDSLVTVVDGSRLVQVGGDGTATPVDAATPGDTAALSSHGLVTQAEMSRDGSRLALAAGGRLYVGVLGSAAPASGTPANRAPGDLQGRPTLSGLRVIEPQLTEVRDVAWADSGHLLVAGRLAGSASAAVLVSDDGVGAAARSRVGLPNGCPVDAVAAAPAEPDLVQCHGQIWQRDGGRWVSPLGVVPLTGRAPFYPG